VCGDDIMAAQPYSGPVAVPEAVAPPSMGGALGATAIKATEADAPAPDKDDDKDDDEGGAWDTASLYEEILDEVEAYEYSANGESDMSA
jgi:NAD-dependent histone deacetylase SIR2